MKICILTPRFPFPENGGDVLRINNISRYLKSKGYTLILVSFCAGEICLKKEYFDLYDTIYVVKHSKFFSVFFSFLFMLTGRPIQCGYYYSPFFARQVAGTERRETPDEYVAHLLRTVPYLEKYAFRKKTIVEMTDALSKTYWLSKKAKGISIKKFIYKIEKKLICRYEKKVVQKFSKVVLVSENDISFLREQNKIDGKSLVCYTNGVNCMTILNNEYDRNKICFVGNMRTLQNQDAAIFFATEIFPLVKNEFPDAIFKIIGAEPSERIMNLHDGKNIYITGFVEDLEREISDCCVSVAPIRIAAGIQNKILVSMACGVPVVLTSLISNAILELKTGENCVIADNSKSIAESIINIMGNVDLRNLLGKNGYEMVKQNYSWNKKLEGYELIPPPSCIRSINNIPSNK